MVSSFLAPGSCTQEGQLASLHLSHVRSLPVVLSTVVSNTEEEGYAEGVVTNTKFGSFPHTTLLNVPWGSQIRASKVDTGTRGRNSAYSGKKRKANAISTDSSSPAPKEAVTASSGFIHVLPPTPENWTTSLPHRTQVVYTPDYSYILHRIRARPGSTLVEAGSGSGSFTHAAVRAVYDGTQSKAKAPIGKPDATKGRGKVFTFEFHPERHEKVKIEMERHHLEHIVTATHRDVYKDGFWLKPADDVYVSPMADAVFLDLPAPWEALKHLTRATSESKPSVLNPRSAVHICTFSPCIEQAQRTISGMRKFGWVDIEMVEMQHKRVDVRREFTGLRYDGMRNANIYAADVDEAVSRLREVEERARAYHHVSAEEGASPVPTKVSMVTEHSQMDASKVYYDEGRIVHRSEPDLKTHTSYLVFAILPRAWSAEDEEEAKAGLSSSIKAMPAVPKSHRQLKKEAKLRRKVANGTSEVPKQSGPSE